jgi:transcriptional regulator with XRE-family HTH domain
MVVTAPSIDASYVGDLVRQHRLQAKLTQAEVALRAHTSITTISLLERGRRTVSTAVLERLVAVVGADPSEAFRLAGLIPPGATSHLLAPELARALPRGQLTRQAREALRREHLAALAADDTRTYGVPVDIVTLLQRRCNLTVHSVENLSNAEFGESRVVRYPAGLDAPAEHHQRRFVLAHMTGHALVAAETGNRCECIPARADRQETEATWLAGHLVMPRSVLAAEVRGLAMSHDVTTAGGLSGLVAEVAARFAVPAWLAIRRVADAGLFSWSAGWEDV